MLKFLKCLLKMCMIISAKKYIHIYDLMFSIFLLKFIKWIFDEYFYCKSYIYKIKSKTFALRNLKKLVRSL